MAELTDAEKEQAWRDFLYHDCMQDPDCRICRDFSEKCIRTGYTVGKTESFVYDTALDSTSDKS